MILPFSLLRAGSYCASLPAIKRYGNCTMVQWDDEDAAIDVYLDAAIDVACALATCQAAERQGHSVDFTGLDRSINGIERGAPGDIITLVDTIGINAQKVLDRVKFSP